MSVKGITNTNVSYGKIDQTVPKSGGYNGTSNITHIDAVLPTKSVVKSKGTSTEDSKQNNENADEQRIKSAVKQANYKMKQTRTGCEFSYHEATKRVTIKVIDKETDEIIREIPPEESLEVLEKIWEMAGLLVDERR